MPSLNRRVKRLANRVLRPLGISIQRPSVEVEQPLRVSLAHLVGRALMRLPADQDLMVVQIGANDGVRSDPVAEFLGGPRIKGLLVEPQPAPFRLLQQRWAGQEDRVRCANVAIAERAGEQAMYVFTQDGPTRIAHLDGISSFDRGHLERHAAKFDPVPRIEEIRVPTQTFDALLAEYEVDRVDVLQIDTEGFDAEILRMADIPRRLPMVVAWEHMHLPSGVQREWWRRMESLGYTLDVQAYDTRAERLQPSAYGPDPTVPGLST